MSDKEKVIKGLDCCLDVIRSRQFSSGCGFCPYIGAEHCNVKMIEDAIELLKEQGKKQITLRKKHVITWSRNDEFSMRKLYEAICETLLDEGELFIEQTDDHEKVEFVFYVAEGR